MPKAVQAYLSGSAQLWHYFGMAEWKVGDKVISIRDGMYMPKNARGEIIERLESFFRIDFIISYVDHFGSSGTMRVAGDDMEKCVKKI